MQIIVKPGTSAIIVSGLYPGQEIEVIAINAAGGSPKATYTTPGGKTAPDAPEVTD
jgi:hypothetical protein